ncbi:hypothetical protein CPB86DRAFT_781466 [Serendipita vermifera]|nr:hypothetical protein CPB86DRAFT_781466 [Serendipita vermifera]
MTTLTSESVRYLVSLDRPPLGVQVINPRAIVNKLQKYIHICKNLEGIYLSGYPPEIFEKYDERYSPWTNWRKQGAIQRLQKICKENSIQIKYKKGDEFVDTSHRRTRAVKR